MGRGDDAVGGRLREYVTGTLTVAAAAGGITALHFTVAGILGKTPVWMAAPLGALIVVGLLVSAASAADRLKGPRRWLLLAALGLVIALGPLVVLAVHGDWSGEFDVFVPQARPSRWRVADLFWFAVPCGIALGTAGVVAYLVSLRRQTARKGPG